MDLVRFSKKEKYIMSNLKTHINQFADKLSFAKEE